MATGAANSDSPIIFSEEALTTEHASFAMEATSIRNLIDEFLSNLTSAESSFSNLQGRLLSANDGYNNLLTGVNVLERTIQLELAELVGEVRRLNQELETQVSVH
jgi:hypothetical protein